MKSEWKTALLHRAILLMGAIALLWLMNWLADHGYNHVSR